MSDLILSGETGLAYPARAGIQKAHRLPDDVGIVDNLRVAESARRDELGSRPGARDGLPFGAGDVAILAVGKCEQGSRVGRDAPRQVEILPGDSELLFEVAFHAAPDCRRETKSFGEGMCISAGVGDRRQKDGALRLEPPPYRERCG